MWHELKAGWVVYNLFIDIKQRYLVTFFILLVIIDSSPGRPKLIRHPLVHQLLLYHRLPQLEVKEGGVDCHCSKDPNREQGKIVNKARSFVDLRLAPRGAVDGEPKVSDSVVEAVRVVVGSLHQTGEDDEVEKCPRKIVEQTTYHPLR